MTKDEVKDTLTAWGNWAHCRKYGTEYPSKALGLQGAASEPDHRLLCSDEKGLEVESAVSCLKKYDTLGHAMINAYYIDKISINRIMRSIQKSKSYTLQVFNGAEAYIGGILSQSRKNKY
ncbi:antiterminator Q family protein [Testudinibacter sp. P80/BLE/0925]|uniref:antiterminator Q family protein n=1 Tax=Testudinibacter sp. TW-1 TaxID=3417757 RepID=UPI003D35FFB9